MTDFLQAHALERRDGLWCVLASWVKVALEADIVKCAYRNTVERFLLYHVERMEVLILEINGGAQPCSMISLAPGTESHPDHSAERV